MLKVYDAMYDSKFPKLNPNMRYMTVFERAGFEVNYKTTSMTDITKFSKNSPALESIPNFNSNNTVTTKSYGESTKFPNNSFNDFPNSIKSISLTNIAYSESLKSNSLGNSQLELQPLLAEFVPDNNASINANINTTTRSNSRFSTEYHDNISKYESFFRF